jgi:hypothetical protein
MSNKLFDAPRLSQAHSVRTPECLKNKNKHFTLENFVAMFQVSAGSICQQPKCNKLSHQLIDEFTYMSLNTGRALLEWCRGNRNNILG